MYFREVLRPVELKAKHRLLYELLLHKEIANDLFIGYWLE